MTRPASTGRITRWRRTGHALTMIAGLLLLGACSGAGAPPAAQPRTDQWSSVLTQARGQTVNWYTYGGDDVLNRFVNGYVADELKKSGVTLKQVRVTDTADAVNKVLGEKEAGRTSGGAVDAIWINGENFATGVQANLWFCGWVRGLPNSRFVDFGDPAVARDFGVPVDGCEAVWQRADSALVYDSSQLDRADVASISSLLAWARAHPGRFAYPASPDFTGSMVVRTILYDSLGGPSSLAGPFDPAAYRSATAHLWGRLNGIEPALWRGGRTYPQSQAAVEKLYGDGEISAFFTYGPGSVGDDVRKGLFPASTREAVPSVGNIANNSFLAIPSNAAHTAGARVLANVLQDPATQLRLYQAEGIYPGIDLSRTDAATQTRFAAIPVPASVLSLRALTRNAQPELSSGYIDRLEKDWTTNVLQQ